MVVIASETSSNMDTSSESIEGLEYLLTGQGEVPNDGPEVQTEEDETECSRTEGLGGCCFDDEKAVNSLDDITRIDFKELSDEGLMKYHFLDVAVAFMFYNWYAGFNGFAGRKSRVVRRTSDGEIIQQTFVCYREGIVPDVKIPSTSRSRVPRSRYRCGCLANGCVHIDTRSGRWFFKKLYNVHNHDLLDDHFMGMLPAHRKMTDHDIWRMRHMRNVGIKTNHIFGLFASEAGGFENVGFRRKDMYNKQQKLRLTSSTDAKAACEYLENLRLSDDTLFWRHRVDEMGRLSHLFWCDGAARRDYSVFGDVVAFDATYKRNKYMCPLVIFSGVNHHNKTIVFCAAIVCDETEQTYVWLLEQLLEAMGGKSPTSVITDGDLSMRNAIRRVFPESHHRLCAWHLLRNANTNVGNARFLQKFRQCMLGDFDVVEFNRRWEKLVADFGLENHRWIQEMYDKRHMWATAHIRGKFFAGFRTTSRCEGLHSQFGRYVNYQNNLLEFLQQYFRCLNYLRFTELEADFASIHGDYVLQTPLPIIERVAGTVYTRDVFLFFQPVIRRACTCTVVNCIRTPSSYIYTVTKYPRQNLEWQVSFSPSTLNFKCSCQRFESLGIACEHIIAVLVYLNIVTLPECLISKRWTKTAKDSINFCSRKKNFSKEPTKISQFSNLVERCKRMSVAAVNCGNPKLMRSTIDIIDAQTKVLEDACTEENSGYVPNHTFFEETLLNPSRVRTKGCGAATRSTPRTKGKGQVNTGQSCGLCKEPGHNRVSCPVRLEAENGAANVVDSNDMDDHFEGTVDTNLF